MGKKIVIFSKREDIIANKYKWFKDIFNKKSHLRVRRPTTEVFSIFTFFPSECSSYWFWSSNFNKFKTDGELKSFML